MNDTMQAALDEVESTLGAIAALLGQEQALHAVQTPEGKIGLERVDNPGILAKLLGTPEEALLAASAALLRAGTAVHGHPGS